MALRDQLRSYERNAEALFRGGSIASVAKNAASQSYRGPGLGSYTPVQIANAWRILINLFDQTKIWIDGELLQDPAQTLTGSVGTDGSSVATFTATSNISLAVGQLVTVTGASAAHSFFNLATVPVTSLPAANQFTYAVKPFNAAVADNGVSARYCPEFGVPPDDADISVYTLMKRRLVVVTDASSDMTDLRLQATLGPRGVAW